MVDIRGLKSIRDDSKKTTEKSLKLSFTNMRVVTGHAYHLNLSYVISLLRSYEKAIPTRKSCIMNKLIFLRCQITSFCRWAFSHLKLESSHSSFCLSLHLLVRRIINSSPGYIAILSKCNPDMHRSPLYQQ